MADLRDQNDIKIYGRLYRANSDNDGQYIVHADQVEGLAEALPDIEPISEDFINSLFTDSNTTT